MDDYEMYCFGKKMVKVIMSNERLKINLMYEGGTFGYYPGL